MYNYIYIYIFFYWISFKEKKKTSKFEPLKIKTPIWNIFNKKSFSQPKDSRGQKIKGDRHHAEFCTAANGRCRARFNKTNSTKSSLYKILAFDHEGWCYPCSILHRVATDPGSPNVCYQSRTQVAPICATSHGPR